MIAISDIVLLTASSAVLAVALTRSYGSGETLTNPMPSTPQISDQTLSSTLSSTQSSASNPRPSTSIRAQSDTDGPRASLSSLTPSQLGLSSTQTGQAGSQPNSQSHVQVDTQAGTTPTVDTAAQAVTTPQPVAPEPVYLSYTVKSGDSLSKIANQFGTSVATLQAVNNLSGTRILVGQKLRYPAP